MPEQMTADEALATLVAGNQRWVREIPHRPRQTVKHRLHLAFNGQSPFATVVCCSDSRVPAEIVFDAGLGDLFVVRTAGNVISAFDLGSIEYGVVKLGIQLILVLGHQKCGAVTAAAGGHTAPGNIQNIIQAIQPAVTIARDMEGDIVENAARANAVLVMQQMLSTSPLLHERARESGLLIAGGYYSLESGEVDIISDEFRRRVTTA